MAIRVLHSLSPSPHNMELVVRFNISFSDVLPCDDMNLCIFFQVERSFDLSRVRKCFFFSI
ncbi:unnamed protein product [Musa hybrid cultivar]